MSKKIKHEYYTEEGEFWDFGYPYLKKGKITYPYGKVIHVDKS